MEILQIVLLILVGMGAGFVQRVSGFGLGIFAMLFLPYLTPDIASAATISCLFSCGGSVNLVGQGLAPAEIKRNEQARSLQC